MKTSPALALLRHLAVVGPMLAVALLASLALTSVLAVLLVLLTGAPLDDGLMPAVSSFMTSKSPLVLALAIVSTSLPLGAVGLIMASRLGPLREVLRFEPVSMPDVVAAIIGMIAVSTAAGALVSLLGLVDDGSLASLNAQFLDMPMSTRLLMVPATALMPGIAEELFFRGWVLSRGERFVTRSAAVVISAIMFGLVHFDPGHALAAGIMGLFMAYVLLRTGSILATIAAHVFNNTLATLVPEINGSEATETWVIVVGMVGGLAVGGLMMWVLAKRHPEPAWYVAPPPPPEAPLLDESPDVEQQPPLDAGSSDPRP